MYLNLGQKIKHYRLRKSESITEASKALGIDRTHLSRIENGHDKPSKTLFWRIVDHFGISRSNVEVRDLANLMGYIPLVIVEERKEVKEPMIVDKKNQESGNTPIDQVEVTMPHDKPVLYTDSVFVTRTQYGMVFDFAQTAINSNKQTVVSRIGMSKQHAEALLRVLETKLKEDLNKPNKSSN